MSQKKLKDLGIFKGDPVLLRGNKRRTTLAVALIDKECDEDKIRMNKVIRKNLRVHLGDIVTVKPCPDAPNLTKVHILPFEDSIEGI